MSQNNSLKIEQFINQFEMVFHADWAYYTYPQNMDKAFDAFQSAYKIDNNELAIHQNLYICGEYFYKVKEFNKALEILEFCVANFDYEKEESLVMIEEIKK